MKKITFFLAIVFAFAGLSAQAPEKMSYQAVVRDAANKLITNHAVGMRISILQTTPTGTAVYKETQTPTSNVNGVVSIEIGAGTSTDVFSNIDWSKGPYYIKTEIDPAGGTSYSITATSQLMSVPYALYAKDIQNKQWTVSGSSIYFNTGKVGIGTNPGADLRQFQVVTTNNQAIAAKNNSTYSTIYASNDGAGASGEFRNHIKIVDGTQGAGKVLTSDLNGNSSWQTPATSKWKTNGSNIYYNDGNVGVGVAPSSTTKFYTKDAGNLYAGVFENNGSYTTIYSHNFGSGSAGNFINNSATSTMYIQNLGTGPAASFAGTIQVEGGNTAEINRNQTGSANIAPVCYGSIEANGTKNNGGSTTNYTVTKSSVGTYDITITGETYSRATHCAIASLGDAGFINTNAVGGKLRVYTYSTSYVATDREFSFVVYKP